MDCIYQAMPLPCPICRALWCRPEPQGHRHHGDCCTAASENQIGHTRDGHRPGVMDRAANGSCLGNCLSLEIGRLKRQACSLSFARKARGTWAIVGMALGELKARTS